MPNNHQQPSVSIMGCWNLRLRNVLALRPEGGKSAEENQIPFQKVSLSSMQVLFVNMTGTLRSSTEMVLNIRPPGELLKEGKLFANYPEDGLVLLTPRQPLLRLPKQMT